MTYKLLEEVALTSNMSEESFNLLTEQMIAESEVSGGEVAQVFVEGKTLLEEVALAENLTEEEFDSFIEDVLSRNDFN